MENKGAGCSEGILCCAPRSFGIGKSAEGKRKKSAERVSLSGNNLRALQGTNERMFHDVDGIGSILYDILILKSRERFTMDSMTWVVFDMMGTVAFAVSGAMVGIEKRMDIFGIVVLALLTAVGGGMVRDVLAGVTPPAALCNITDFMLAIVTAAVVSMVYTLWSISHRGKHLILTVYNIFDSIGLASFTITGMITGLSVQGGNPFVLPILLGVITAVGGGILRDLMAQRMPAVLYKAIYAVASLPGALAASVFLPYLGITGMAWLCFAVVIVLRFGALQFGWHLFHPRPGRIKRRTREKVL